MRPKMIVVAGPPGSGKSVAFPVDSFGVDSFNADDRSAQLNNGSYQGIPLEIRAIVNKEFEAFVEDHIRNHKSFAIETTLRSDITFRQAGQARAEGFEIQMRYIALTASQNLKRVIARALAGGHSAPADQLQKIHEASLKNLAERFGRWIGLTCTTTPPRIGGRNGSCPPKAARLRIFTRHLPSGWK